MKTILIATDFSAAARNASIYGMELARAFNARVVLFTAYQQIPVQSTETALMLDSKNIKQITLQLLEQEAKEINSRNITVVETRCNEGFIADSILNAAEEMHADLIVSAMKLNDKTFRKIFGSTVTA
ncbi:MAG: universal stress protein, partial [Flavisolibacter sp.]